VSDPEVIEEVGAGPEFREIEGARLVGISTELVPQTAAQAAARSATARVTVEFETPETPEEVRERAAAELRDLRAGARAEVAPIRAEGTDVLAAAEAARAELRDGMQKLRAQIMQRVEQRGELSEHRRAQLAKMGAKLAGLVDLDRLRNPELYARYRRLRPEFMVSYHNKRALKALVQMQGCGQKFPNSVGLNLILKKRMPPGREHYAEPFLTVVSEWVLAAKNQLRSGDGAEWLADLLVALRQMRIIPNAELVGRICSLMEEVFGFAPAPLAEEPAPPPISAPLPMEFTQDVSNMYAAGPAEIPEEPPNEQ